MCIRCWVMIWKCIYCCNPPKSVFPPLCHSVSPEAKPSDRQWECSNSLYSAFYPIIFKKKTAWLNTKKAVISRLCQKVWQHYPCRCGTSLRKFIRDVFIRYWGKARWYLSFSPAQVRCGAWFQDMSSGRKSHKRETEFFRTAFYGLRRLSAS